MMESDFIHAVLHEFSNHKPSDEEKYNAMREYAKNNPKLYHCTGFESLLSIIENREFWAYPLSGMNDSDEQRRIGNSSYSKNKVCISSFSSRIFDSENDWEEYSKQNKENAVIFSVCQDWFTREAYSIENNKKIKIDDKYNNLKQLRKSQVFDFIGVYYDDQFETEPEYQTGKYIFRQGRYAGFVKKRAGEIKGSDCQKKWDEECEIRLRIVLDSYFGCDFEPDKIIVKLSEEAFSEFDVKFSPYLKADVNDLKNKLHEELPDSTIHYL